MHLSIINITTSLLKGEGAFFRGYKRAECVRAGRVVMGLTDDVSRDMVLGKELFLEVRLCVDGRVRVWVPTCVQRGLSVVGGVMY